ncbi:MAG: DUF7782 domain-containing protein [Corynebacterium sp.]|uniref:DUF7782 domain-containing protein n=1 Tax=Corynebacterium sp. TaxID=1720 RepID=UPI003F9D5F03
MTVDAHSPALGDLVRALTALDYGPAMLLHALGREGYGEALAGDPGAAVWHLDRRCASGEVAGPREDILTRSFFLREPVDAGELAEVIGEDLLDGLLHCGAVETVGAPHGGAAPGDPVRSQVDIRPVSHQQHGDSRPVLIVSDPDASMEPRDPGDDHVPGVGQAPLTLLNQIPAGPVGRLLDLGTGSGVLALVVDAGETVATDVHDRALGFARASHRGVPDRPVEWRRGSWFEPVAGEEFDMIVSNPPFVVGPPEDGSIYRDAGLELDDATRTVVEGAAAHLAPDGTAHLLGAWATGLSESPAHRVAGWIPPEGIRAWIVQRDEVTPSVYARTWIADASVDLRSARGRDRASRWLDYFAGRGVDRIGMGYVHLQRIDGPSEVTFEVIDSPELDYFGDEVSEYFTRAAWLADNGAEEVLGSRFQVRPGLARETVEVATIGTEDMPSIGFQPEVLRLTRTEGPRFSHDIDAPLSAVVAGLSPQGLSLRDTAELYCAVNGLDADEFCDALVPLVVDLVRHGMILPDELIATDSPVREGAADGGGPE